MEMERYIDLPYPAQRVWAIAGDFEASSRTESPIVESLTVTGKDVGALRIVVLTPAAGGGRVVEKLTRLDHGKHSLEYVLTEPGPLPHRDYSGSLSVIATSDKSCRLVWRARFTVAPGLEEMAASMSEGAVMGSFATISAMLVEQEG